MIEVKKLNNLTSHHLITVATELEVKHLQALRNNNSAIRSSLFKIADNIDCIITGIGQYNTIKAITQHISLYGKPTSLINIGIAGTYNMSAKLTSLVKVKKDIAYDQKVIHNNVIQDWKASGLPTAKSNILIPKKPEYEKKILLEEATGLTSDTISNNPERIKQITDIYNPTTETMEGAAFFFVANEFEIPSIQIRSISNYVGETNKSLWKISESIEELNRFVYEDLLTKLA
jgi:futalosine hydrolase